MSQALVSCVIAVFNGGNYLREAIDSVLAQSHRQLELIVVDDGSTDDSGEIAANYGARLRLLRQPNAGVSVARNNGVEAGRGELVSFLDADDLLHPDKLALQLQRFAERPELEFCDGHTRNFWSPELDAGRLAREHRRRERIDRIDSGHISSWLLRRELFFRAGGFRPGMAYAEDIDFRSRCRDAGAPSATLPEVLSCRRFHLANVSSGDERAQREALAASMKAHLDRLRGARNKR